MYGVVDGTGPQPESMTSVLTVRISVHNPVPLPRYRRFDNPPFSHHRAIEVSSMEALSRVVCSSGCIVVTSDVAKSDGTL